MRRTHSTLEDRSQCVSTLFADLDGTLIFSRNRTALSCPDTALKCVERRGEYSSSFVTHEAASGIARLLRAGSLIPVTTRSTKQYHRVELPGPPPALALVANGGRLLRDGDVDRGYTSLIATSLTGSTPLGVVIPRLAHMFDPQFCDGLRTIDGLFCCTLVDKKMLPSDWLEELNDFALSVGWVVADTGRKIYVLPSQLTKGAAVERIATMRNIDYFIAAGDSVLDVSMLDLAAASMVAKDSKVATDGLLPKNGKATGNTGVLAGEEIVRWATAKLNKPSG